jgi:5-methylcytosine-specific restriction endonuclease McrA
MTHAHRIKSLSDDELLRRLSELLARSRRAETELVAHIAEVDARRLYAREASPSMFAYATEVLHLSEHEAYLRITVARASREHPMLLELLTDGRLHLSGIAKLVPHLTLENREGLLERAAHKTKRQIEELIAELSPKSDVRARVRKLPAPRKAGPTAVEPTRQSEGLPESGLLSGEDRETARALGPNRVRGALPTPPPPGRPAVEPLAPARYRVQFTASAELREKLARLQALSPGADLAQVIELAVTERLERVEAKRFARVKKPRKSLENADTAPSSRYIPAPVRRAVYERDGGRCTYADAKGRRCNAHRSLEFHHHARPYARGGEHSVENLRLCCKLHNTLMAEQEYGRERMARFRRAPDRVSEPSGGYGIAGAYTRARSRPSSRSTAV